MWALIKPSTLTLLAGPLAWDEPSFRAALLAALPGFTPFLPATEPADVVTWSGVDLAIVPAAQTFDPLGPYQTHDTPQNTVTAGSVAQRFPAIDSPQLLAAAASAASRRSYVAQLQGQAATAQKRGDYGRAVQILIKAQEV